MSTRTFGACFKGVQVTALTLEASLEAFDEHVVQPAAMAVYVNAGVIFPQSVGKGKIEKLAAMVGVEDIGLALFR